MARFRTNVSSTVDAKPTHKNLYILNLPLDATTDQLTALFSSYGTVVHCVILAMLDAQARRRGFIDMSSSNEAKEAIEGLNGFVWHGYPIEVSYAIVQRSGGPFDQATGHNIIKRNVPRNRFNTGPRRVPSDSAIGSGFFGAGESNGSLTPPLSFGLGGVSGFGTGLPSPGYSETSSRAPSEREEEPTSATDPFTIFIAGLDPVAIIDDEDFRHALQPYGTITAATLCRDEQGTSRGFGIVTFGNQVEASQACEGINGKIINGRRLSAHKYVYQTHPSLGRTGPSLPPGTGFGPSPVSLRPSTFQRRSYLPSNLVGDGSATFAPTSAYATSSILQHVPLLNARLNSHSPHLAPMWPPSSLAHSPLSPSHRLDQIPMGSIGTSSVLNSDTWVPPLPSLRAMPNNTSSFFKANGASRPIEIKPDLKETTDKQRSSQEMPRRTLDKQLGDAFMPIPKSISSSERFNEESGKGAKESDEGKCANNVMGTPSYTTPSHVSLLRTPGTTSSPWATGGGGGSAMGLDSMSPESTLSMASSTSSSLSPLNTPEAVRGSDSTTIWNHGGSHERMAASIHSGVSPGSWLSNSPPSSTEKRANVSGSAILSLQSSEAMDKAGGRAGNTMAPVGHEKNSSSPLRIMRPFKENGTLDGTD